LKRQHDDVLDSKNKLDSTLRQLENDLQIANTEHVQVEGKEDGLTKTAKKQQETIDELNSAKENANKELQKTIKNFKKLEGEVKESQRKNGDFNNQLGQNQNLYKRLQEEIEKLKTILTNLDSNSNLSEKGNKQLEMGVNEKLSNVEELTETNSKLDRQIKDIQFELEGLNDTRSSEAVEEVEKVLNELEHELQSLKVSIEKESEIRNATENSRKNIAREIEEIRLTLEDNEKILAGIDRQGKKLNVDFEDQSREFAKITGIIKDLEKKLKKAEKEEKQIKLQKRR